MHQLTAGAQQTDSIGMALQAHFMHWADRPIVTDARRLRAAQGCKASVWAVLWMAGSGGVGCWWLHNLQTAPVG